MWHGLQKLPNQLVGRPKIMPPLGDTVGFVYNNLAYFEGLQDVAEELTSQAFRRNIKDFNDPDSHIVEGLVKGLLV